MQRRYQVFKREPFWIVRDITDEDWFDIHVHGRAEYAFREHRDAMQFLYPKAVTGVDVSAWPQELRDIHGV